MNFLLFTELSSESYTDNASTYGPSDTPRGRTSRNKFYSSGSSYASLSPPPPSPSYSSISLPSTLASTRSAFSMKSAVSVRSASSAGITQPHYFTKTVSFPEWPELDWESEYKGVRQFHPILPNKEFSVAVDANDNVHGIWFSGKILKIFDKKFNRMTMNINTRIPMLYNKVFMQNSNN